MTRIFDNPNHKHYGPVRRLWIVLVQLDLLKAAERWSEHMASLGAVSGTWDQFLAGSLDAKPSIPEAAHQRLIIGILLEGWA